MTIDKVVKLSFMVCIETGARRATATTALKIGPHGRYYASLLNWALGNQILPTATFFT